MRKPWYRRQTKTWYVQLESGEQVPLGKDETEYLKPPKKAPTDIQEKWHEVMAAKGQLPLGSDAKMSELVTAFLAYSSANNTPKTRVWHGYFLDDFSRRHPNLHASKLTEAIVERWLSAKRKRDWNATTRRSAITVLKGCLNWGVKKKAISENPIASMERPTALRRERVLDATEKTAILDFYPPDDPFRYFLVALTESGCRPSEVMKVEAKDVNLELGIWVLHGKSTKVTGKKRVVYLTPTLLDLTKKLASLFRRLYRQENSET